MLGSVSVFTASWQDSIWQKKVMRVMIRAARPGDAASLTELTFSSKRHWHYPEHYYDIWRNELTITPQYVEAHRVYVYEQGGIICGYYSLVTLVEELQVGTITIYRGTWLEHMFVHPDRLHTGIGTRLLGHLREACRARGVSLVRVLADPNARGFYEKSGWKYVEEHPSTIPGRTTPLLTLEP
jgi:maltose O-acetyltransferase